MSCLSFMRPIVQLRRNMFFFKQQMKKTLFTVIYNLHQNKIGEQKKINQYFYKQKLNRCK